MARTIEEIETSITNAVASEPRLAALNSASKVSTWRLFVYCIAVCIWSLEVIFGNHKAEVSSIIAEQRPHSPNWYRNKAKAFQWGYDLIDGTDLYDNTGLTDEQIEQSKIITYSAVNESKAESRLIVKIATSSSGELQPITTEQFEAFSAYMNEVKDAGVNITVINYLPDRLYISGKIYYDPLVLDSEGNSILAGGKPVEVAFNDFLKNLPFNGELILAHLTDKLQIVPGVKIPVITSAASSWIDASTNDYGAIEVIAVRKIPVSGYFQILDFSQLTYEPYV